MDVKLWPHQERALLEIPEAIEAGESRICVTSPTGGGKTYVMLGMLEDGKSTALYTDRRMLLSQLADRLTREGYGFGIRASGHDPRLLDDIQLCMMQTEASRSLNGRRDIHRCDQVIVDECHKLSGQTMQTIVDEHRKLVPNCTIIGFTATPLGIDHFYDHLIVAGTNSELRSCGAIVPAYHYGPDEPDVKWIGKVDVSEGECAIPNARRKEYCTRVFGRIVEHYNILNPERLPTILFGPDVAGSLWIAQHLCEQGITAAHIDGERCWLDGEEVPTSEEVRKDIAERCKSGDINVVCNRFVLREGIDWPFIRHGILATIFGSLTSYIQAGGRLLRADDGKESSCIQDHGGNWHRHGSVNVDREWELGQSDRIMGALRVQRIREKKEPEPIVCQKCHACRISGPRCHACGHQSTSKRRMVLQKDGSLKEMSGDIYKPRRIKTLPNTEQKWKEMYYRARNSRNRMTFTQAEGLFFYENHYYPPRTLTYMPKSDIDWFLPVAAVPADNVRWPERETVK